VTPDNSEAGLTQPAASGTDPTPSFHTLLGEVGSGKKYRARFAVIYGVLAAVLVGVGVGFVTLFIEPNTGQSTSWSTWKPNGGNLAGKTRQIADHVSSSYRLNAAGDPLVAVLSSKPEVTVGTEKVPIDAIAIRSRPQSNDFLKIIQPVNSTRMFTFCGLGSNCSIVEGEPSAERGRLVRREALEVALYTFKFVPEIDSVIAFMPPPPGEATTSILFLEESALKDQLKSPLNETLTLSKPPLPAQATNLEKEIDELTLKNVFSYELQGLPTGGAAMILDPTT
jgi:hypothetical protein